MLGTARKKSGFFDGSCRFELHMLVSSSYPNKSGGCLCCVSNVCCVALFLAIAAIVFPDKPADDGTKNNQPDLNELPQDKNG
jgi:hypothetical protein